MFFFYALCWVSNDKGLFLWFEVSSIVQVYNNHYYDVCINQGIAYVAEHNRYVLCNMSFDMLNK